ncbi:MAG TPA: hypothetical protein VIA09_01030 [Nitrososphaeraceae archaeon]
MKMRLVDMLGCGCILWFIGYAFSLSLFPIVPVAMIGWLVSAVLIPITILVALTRFKNSQMSFSYYLFVGIVWLAIAFSLDYLFIIVAFNVSNYYNLDVFIYYVVTFLIPLVIGIKYGRKQRMEV